jgi:hypothetical protein
MKKILKEESDRDKFLRLAAKRVPAAIKAIRLIGNLSNKSNYDYTEGDVRKILNALQEEFYDCKKQFQFAQKRRHRRIKFTLE